MSQHERIFSLETEYAVNFYPASDSSTPDPNQMVAALRDVIVTGYGLSSSPFLANGSKLHPDVGHAEWSLPECRTAREAAIYDKAADDVLGQSLAEAELWLARRGFHGRLLVAKNNVDSAGNTYGCHENYLMQHDTELLSGEAFLRYTARCLIPFLVTRQVLVGSGRLIPPVTSGHTLSFELSQRARFINYVVSKETTQERAIINLGRETEPLAGQAYRRLHLIVGDANLSGWATWLKLGTLGILLRMIEDLAAIDLPWLQNPVEALQTISADPACRATVLTRDGQHLSALNIQIQYYELAGDYLDRYGSSPEEDEIMNEWGLALEAVEQDPMRLRGRADWVTKKSLMDSQLAQLDLSWQTVGRRSEAITDLQAIDLRYHDVGPEGLFTRLQAHAPYFAEADRQRAARHPPPYTRANLRGTAIAAARQTGAAIKIDGWIDLFWNGGPRSLVNPFDFAAPWLSPTLHEQLPVAARHADPSIRARAASYLAWRNDLAALTLLAQLARHDPHEMVRRTAVETLGIHDHPLAQRTLLEAERDPSLIVRWAAEDVLERIERGERPTPPATPPPPIDSETLIQLIH